MPPATVAVLADDLTSAADGAAPFRRNGHRARVLFAPDGAAAREAGVTAVDLGTRLLGETEAAARTREAAAAYADAELLIKTVDSTLRGHVAAELRAALAGSGRRTAILAPAFPAEGRTTVGGVQYVRGVRVDASEFAHDPAHPVRSADLTHLLPEAIVLGGAAARGSVPAAVPAFAPAPEHAPDAGPTSAPGLGLADAPGAGPTSVPGPGPAWTSGAGPAPGPGPAPAAVPASAPAPERVPGAGPGPDSAAVPAPGLGLAGTAGAGPTSAPGPGPARTPRTGPAPGPALPGPAPHPFAELPRLVEAGGIVVCSAATDADLDAVVAAVPRPQEVLWVGSPGLADALARRYARRPADALPELPAVRRPLAVVGSAHPASRRQLAALRARSIGRPGPVAALHTPEERADDPGALIRRLAERTRERTRSGLADGLVLTGGETAAAVLGALGGTGIELYDEPEPGIARGTLHGPAAPRLPVLVKAGGFGDDATLVRLHALLAAGGAR
ncbi:four-carbon acid sugar kinase family protein [Streptomyces sp. NPDC006339]|uniref:four-carbon acid sugar kinase family protein n=1 Tax=Streptomyces sp. NPDC006339 TaxID=3156755 RepID=UPI0033A1D6DC